MNLPDFEARLAEIEIARGAHAGTVLAAGARLGLPLEKVRDELAVVDGAAARVQALLEALQRDLAAPEAKAPAAPRAARTHVLGPVREFLAAQEDGWIPPACDIASALGLHPSSVAKALKKIKAEKGVAG